MVRSMLYSDMEAEQVRSRFDYAMTSGNPRWLWPEVEVPEWRSIIGTIEQIARDVLSQGWSQAVLKGEVAAVSVAAFTTGMGPMLGHWLRQERFWASPSSAEVLAHHLAHNEKRMEKMASRAIRVVEGLARQGIEVTVLKGMHTAFAYFPNPGTRPMSDIDLLIEPAAEAVAATVLEELGFRHSGKSAYPERTWRKLNLSAEPKSLFFVHEDDQWSIDLHLTLDQTLTSIAPPIRLDAANKGEGGRWALSPAARNLGHPMQLIHLAGHASFPLSSLTLLRLTELVLVIRKDVDQGLLSWTEFSSAAAQAGALGLLYPALQLCEQLAPGTVPDSVRLVCRDNSPPALVRLVDSFTPATVHGMMRCAVMDRFMWLPSRTLVAKQVLYDLLPLDRSISEIVQICWLLVRQRLNRNLTY